MSAKRISIALTFVLLSLWLSGSFSCQAYSLPEKTPDTNARLPGDSKAVEFYPRTTADRPSIPSPCKLPDGTEVVVVFTKDRQYAIVPVTVENGPLNLPYGSRGIGKGRQIEVNENDFPTLAATGLHSQEQLPAVKTITGKAVAEITRIGRPEMYSGEGFMAADEDIISVLKGDNRLVKRLALTHPQTARPLFHIWNLILKEYELHRIGRSWDNFQHILYNGKKIRFGEVHPTRGFQQSIFNDEIMGAFQINFFRDLEEYERTFLLANYPNLTENQMAELIEKLSHILTGEMEPYYVMRYGFYEGHTGYRVDPIAIAFIFGLKTLEEIEAAFPGQLYNVLTMHFTSDHLP